MGGEEVVHHHHVVGEAVLHPHQMVDAEVLQKRVGLGHGVDVVVESRFLIIVWAVSARLHTIFT
jgi:hypothetical protein